MDKPEIRKLKYNRLKPEERFLIDIFDGLVVEQSLKNNGDFFYFKDGYCYFYHDAKNGTLWYDYSKIWVVFESKFEYNYQQTNVFIKSMVEEHLKLKVSTTLSI